MNIAVIDNDEALLRSLQLLLSSRCGNVMGFTNPLEAVVALSSIKQLDALIADYQMPEMDGCSFLAKVNRLPLNVSVKILISARTDVLENKTITDCGADFYLPKPFNLNELLMLIHSFNKKIDI